MRLLGIKGSGVFLLSVLQQGPAKTFSSDLLACLLGLMGSDDLLLFALELGLKCSFRAARLSKLERLGEVTSFAKIGESIDSLFSEDIMLVLNERDSDLLTDPPFTVGVVMQVE